MTPKELLTREFLQEHYIDKEKSAQKIQEEFGLGSYGIVEYHIHKFGLSRPRRHFQKHRVAAILTEAVVRELYIDGKMGAREMAKKLGVCRQAIGRALKRFGIEPHDNRVKTPAKLAYRKKRSKAIGELSGHYWSRMLSNAKARSIQVKITQKWAWQLFLKQGCKCAYSGVDICFSKPGRPNTETTASLDRIDSSKPYTKTNVHWIHKRLQNMKMSMPHDKFTAWCHKAGNSLKELLE